MNRKSAIEYIHKKLENKFMVILKIQISFIYNI